jgi:hypothetical protein
MVTPDGDAGGVRYILWPPGSRIGYCGASGSRPGQTCAARPRRGESWDPRGPGLEPGEGRGWTGGGGDGRYIPEQYCCGRAMG